MSLAVFVHPDLSTAEIGGRIRLEGPEARHAVTVKRVEPGEHLALVDSAGLRAEVSVEAVEGKDSLVATVDSLEYIAPPALRVVIIQAIPKSERAELAVDLATQAGADEIIAWQAQRCVSQWDAKKAPKAIAKWQAAARAAAKQSRRARIPVISGPLTTAQVAQLLSESFPETGQGACAEVKALVLHEEATESIKTVSLPQCGTLYVIVGPEGGIGSQELEQLGAVPVKLGPEVLRTASAAMVALAAIGVRTQRW